MLKFRNFFDTVPKEKIRLLCSLLKLNKVLRINLAAARSGKTDYVCRCCPKEKNRQRLLAFDYGDGNSAGDDNSSDITANPL